MLLVLPLVLIPFASSTDPSSATVSPGQFTTAPQCKCSEIDTCTKELAAETDRCKKEPTCEAILAKTGGNVEKIRQCLDEEHKVIMSIEECVKESVGGQIGCTNDAVPKNLTIPLVPVIQIPVDGPLPTRRRRTTPDSVQAPPELAQFLVCVDHCSMAPKNRTKRSAVTCAYKLQCALAPPDEKVQKSFVDCEHKLNVDPDARFKKSCHCLKAAGITSIKCD